VTRPLDRECKLPQIGKLDAENGEFWVENPFLLTKTGKNLSAFERNHLYLNVGGDSFLDASFASNADIDADSRSVIAADFDRDGACDLLVGNDGGGPLRLFLNRFPRKNRRVQIRLAGTASNRPAIGSRVVLHCGGRKIVRDLFPANGFMGQAPAELLVGIGEATTIEKLTVRWPTGKVQEFSNLPGDSVITITEGTAKPQIAPLVVRVPKSRSDE
jgi:enediyne biosynthesis protein E4